MKIKCPWCRTTGTDREPYDHRPPTKEEQNYKFEVRGNYGGRPVRKCLNCGNGVRVTLLPPRFHQVPPDEWEDLQERWEAYKAQYEAEADEREAQRDALRTPEQRQHNRYYDAIQATESLDDLESLEAEITAWQATVPESSPDYTPEFRVWMGRDLRDRRLILRLRSASEPADVEAVIAEVEHRLSLDDDGKPADPKNVFVQTTRHKFTPEIDQARARVQITARGRDGSH